MPRHFADRQPDDDDFADDEFDGDDGAVADDPEPTVPCRYCRSPVYEDAVRCPSCGQYQSAEDAPAARKSWRFVLMMAAPLLAAGWWATR